MKGRWLLFVLLVAAVLLTTVLWGAWGDVVGSRSHAQIPIHEVARGDFSREVHAEGHLQAATATVLMAPSKGWGGMRIAWLAPDGIEVEPGQIVVRFDPSDMEQKLEEGRVERATTSSRITQQKHRDEGVSRGLELDAGIAAVELDYARRFQSKDPEIFSRVEIVEAEIDETLAIKKKAHAETVRTIREDLATVDLDLLEIERRKADLKIRQAEGELEELEIRAPHAGIFTLKEQRGELPEVGSMVWRGNPVAEIPQLDVMEAKVFVLEADAGGLEVGLSATVTLDAHPGKSYDATVKQVEALAQPRSRAVPVQYFGVVLELERTEPEWMKPGQRVQARLTLESRESAIVVPRQAMFEIEGGTVVYVRRGAGFQPVDVRLGPAGLGRQVIEEGLAAGDRIALRDPTGATRWTSAEATESPAGVVPNGASP